MKNLFLGILGAAVISTTPALAEQSMGLLQNAAIISDYAHSQDLTSSKVEAEKAANALTGLQTGPRAGLAAVAAADCRCDTASAAIQLTASQTGNSLAANEVPKPKTFPEEVKEGASNAANPGLKIAALGGDMVGVGVDFAVRGVVPALALSAIGAAVAAVGLAAAGVGAAIGGSFSGISSLF